jgi:hypothetical protein
MSAGVPIWEIIEILLIAGGLRHGMTGERPERLGFYSSVTVEFARFGGFELEERSFGQGSVARQSREEEAESPQEAAAGGGVRVHPAAAQQGEITDAPTQTRVPAARAGARIDRFQKDQP